MIKYTVKYTVIFKKWYTDLVKPKLYSGFMCMLSIQGWNIDFQVYYYW